MRYFNFNKKNDMQQSSSLIRIFGKVKKLGDKVTQKTNETDNKKILPSTNVCSISSMDCLCSLLSRFVKFV